MTATSKLDTTFASMIGSAAWAEMLSHDEMIAYCYGASSDRYKPSISHDVMGACNYVDGKYGHNVMHLPSPIKPGGGCGDIAMLELLAWLAS